MYVVTLRVRAKSPEAAQEICRRFSHLLQLHQEPAFAGGFCAISVADPCQVQIEERWGTRSALAHWRQSPQRQQAVSEMTRLAVAPPEMEEAVIWGQ